MIAALVLTAGLATRLRPLSLVRAKAAVPVAGQPLIHRILRSLASAGVTDIVMNLHHLPHTLTALVGDGSDLGVRVRYSWESPVLGSGGGIRRALPLLESTGASAFLVINGDVLTTADIPALAADHERSGALATLAVVPNVEPTKYAGLAVSDDGAVTGLVPRGSAGPSWHFIGVQAVDPVAYATVPDGVPYESVSRLYPDLIAARPGCIRAYRCEAGFLDIGTPADYLATCLHLAARDRIDLARAAGARIAPGARVERTVFWDNVVVEAGAWLRECVVMDGVRVPGDTGWHGVTLRVADGPLLPGERRIDGLAVGGI